MFSNYIIANPSENITALVTAPVESEQRQAIVKEIFDNEPTCEQVGFVEFIDENSLSLEMMGGEFCGNATISAAAYMAESYNLPVYEDMMVNVLDIIDGKELELPVRIIRRKDTDEGQQLYEGTVQMPIPEIAELHGYPIVNMEGISHVLVPKSEISKSEAELLVKEYAAELGAAALGLILYETGRSKSPAQSLAKNTASTQVSIEPLVYVKGSDTLFWEHGCASGSTAMGYYLFAHDGIRRTAVLQEGGVMNIKIINEAPQLTGTIIL